VKKVLGFVAIFFTLALTLTTTAFAKNLNSEVVTLDKDQVVTEDLFVSGEKITISGKVDGDLFVAGGNVTVDGQVSGDVLAAGGDITINGIVNGDIRVAGGNITLGGKVGHNVTAAGGNVTIAKEGVIAGSLTAMSGNLTVDGKIAKNVKASAGRAMINSLVGGNVEAMTDNLGLGPTATISGNLRYISQNPATIGKGATVSGTVAHDVPMAAKPLFELGLKASILLKLVLFLPIFALGFTIMKLAPRSSQALADQVANHYVRNFFVGLAMWMIGWVVAIILMATIIGIPLALILMFMLLVYLYLSLFPVSLALGRRLVKDNSDVIQLAAGMGLLFVISFVPIAGKLALFVATFVGLASLAIGKYQIARVLRAKKVL